MSPHLDPRRVALVIGGGTVGAALRDRIESLAPPDPGAFPWATFAINVTGALALGLLIELLTARVADARRRQRLQLALGTGLLGGYTTYSTFVLETVSLAGHGVTMALLYATASVGTGFLAAALGMGLGRRIPGRRA